MAIYRGKALRPVHPKIYVWAHSAKAEIEYFQSFKNNLRTPLLMPKKDICLTPQELIKKVIDWKKLEICEEDEDQVWIIFDVDDFYKNGKEELLEAIRNALKANIKIAYANECFELWILLHFRVPTTAINRGKDIIEKIQKEFKKRKLGEFEKNQNVFEVLLESQNIAVKNAKKILSNYNNINWDANLSNQGNPSTSIHFLVEQINSFFGSDDNK